MEEVEQYEPAPQQGYGVMPTNEGTIQFQIQAQEIIEELEHLLRNEQLVYDVETGQEIWKAIEGTTPMINNKGICALMFSVKPNLTKIFILSDFERWEIENMVIDTAAAMLDLMEENWVEFGIHNTSEASVIVRVIQNAIFATLKKGYQGNYLKFLRTVQTVQDVTHHTQTTGNMQPQQKSGGFLSRLKDKWIN